MQLGDLEELDVGELVIDVSLKDIVVGLWESVVNLCFAVLGVS